MQELDYISALTTTTPHKQNGPTVARRAVSHDVAASTQISL